MKLFIEHAQPQNLIRIIGDDARHLFVLRPSIGQILDLSDGTDFFYEGKITAIDREGLTVEIIKKEPIVQTNVYISLLAAFLKGDKNEFIIQKATELGAEEVLFYPAANCVSKMKDKAGCKAERFQKIAKLAAMQCGRNRIPQIRLLSSFTDALLTLDQKNGFLFYENATYRLSRFLKEKQPAPDTAFAIGPEGGFAPEEIRQAEEHGIPILSLGDRILRAETAPICALSVLLANFGEI